MDTAELKAGDVVQMSPDCTNQMFAGCFMIVDEVRDWGVTGYFPWTDGEYPYREENGKFHRIGKAEWLAKDD